ncbi:sterile alpha motif domain-containing protein 15-like [Engraulis encrasicolus]|uniref:sterile alpha motif domain-containing protein 15-like n=1 Tax=Engraulis encrasicolus TaxID=184585 RepID=UPI002FCEC3B4
MSFLFWTSEDVAKWIQSLGYPQYTACFTENVITGRKLIHINCCNLPKLGITNFKDMKAIAAHVRQLLDVSEPLWSRSLADYRRDDMGMYLEMKSRTGERANSLTLDKFLKDRNTC